MLILEISLPVLLRKAFDYLPPDGVDCTTLQPGVRILVPFRNRKLVGILLAVRAKSYIPRHKLKMAISILAPQPVLPPDILRLCYWTAAYYHYPLGMVLQTAVPSQIMQDKLVNFKPDPNFFTNNQQEIAPWALNVEQQAIVSAVANCAAQFAVITIDGVTGSGKTEVYLHIIAQIIAQKQQSLVLVPEISLTPQTLNYFKQRFQVPVIPWHSKLTNKDRALAWWIAQLGLPSILIGTRSAIFTPLPALGVIIIDEEHDLSFKQQDSLRYNARDLAIWRARDRKIPVILGSATPSLETLHRSWQGLYQYFHLSQRAGEATSPSFNVIDIKSQVLEGGLSPVLVQKLRKHLAAGNQVLLFLNRRGFAPILMCHFCGWMAECNNCDARLTYHLQQERLYCHHCEAQQLLPKSCNNCGAQELHMLGLGTEKLEFSLAKHFPDAKIVRIDRDTIQGKGKITQILSGINQGQFQIIVGTQMIAKGHHFPNVTMVGIIDADYGLFGADFRASERLGQLIMQVAGRAGRANKPGEVWIQTHYPEHRLLRLLLENNYQQFAQELLTERKLAALPPFTALAILHAAGKKPLAIEQFLLKIKNLALSLNLPIRVFGPVTSLMSRRAGDYRWQLLFQAQQKSMLQQFLTKLVIAIDSLPYKSVRWSLDVDPMDMM